MKPKYALGEEVVFPLVVGNAAVGVEMRVPHTGLVTGIGYDPKHKGTPQITYRILPEGSEQFLFIGEDVIISVPPETKKAISRIRDIARRREIVQ